MGLEVAAAKICERDPLPGGELGMPFKASALEILDDPALVNLEIRNWVTELCYSAVGIEEIQEGIANLVAIFWKEVTSW